MHSEAVGTESRRSRRARTGGSRARPAGRSIGLRTYGAARSGLLTIAAILGVLSIIAFAGALIFGIRPIVVISGSMEPDIPVGSVIFSRPIPVTEVNVGDIVTVERPRNLGLVTHRVVGITDVDGATGLELKGDANKVGDPQPYLVTTAGLYSGHVLYLGYVTLFFQSPHGFVAGIGIVTALLAVFVLDPARFHTPQNSRQESRPTSTG